MPSRKTKHVGSSHPGGKPLAWIIDSEQWPRAYLRAELIERGYEVIGFPKLSQALALLARVHLPKPQAIVIELRGQKITRRAIQRTAQANIPLIAIGGNIELNNPLLPELKRMEIVRRPTTIGAVADAVERSIIPSP